MDDYSSQKLESEMEALQSSEGEREEYEETAAAAAAPEDLENGEDIVESKIGDGDWRETINKVVPAVVDLRVTACRAFDTELASSGCATGFVVDKKRGIILTNRHVVKPGPVVAQAIFANREEISVYPIYRDPVHDFGFFRYDPGAVQFLDYEEIPLAPEAACVGLEIRVVGNDSREKISILAGTLARLDRDAPKYKKDGYNDFNTFYIQAASGTKGGSSGSPVIDRQGRAVALNAGGKSSNTSYYLPLERVVRALRFIQNGKDSNISKWEVAPIPRGTLQVTFQYKGFEKARRLGLQSETEQMVRRASPPSETGILVVHSVVPGGPAHMQLEPGDVLICMNGEVTTRFLKLETLLDDSVGQKVELQIERGGKSLTVNLLVQDLHSITPNHFLEVSGAVIHSLSYQQARNFCFHCGLVYVAEPGYMLYRAGVPRHAIIKKFNDVEILQLEDIITVLSKLSRGARVPLEYITHHDRHRRKPALVTVDRHEWYDAPKIYTRDDNTGLWCIRPAIQSESPLLSSFVSDIGQVLKTETSELNSETTPLKHMLQTNDLELTLPFTSLDASNDHASTEENSNDKCVVEINTQVLGDLSRNGIVDTDSTSHEVGENKLDNPIIGENTSSCHNDVSTEAANSASFPERSIEPSLVVVEVNVPPSCLLDGEHSRHFCGTGVIVHHSEGMGLVAVDRNTVPISACDVMLSFAAFPVEIPGEVVFLHPVYNFALVAYDPSALGTIGASMARAAELHPDPALCRGESVYLVGLRTLRAISRKSTVTNSCLSLHLNSADPPCYKATNMEVIELDSDFGNTFTGVLSNDHGKVQALWASFSVKVKSAGSTSPQLVKGIPIYMISQILDNIISGANGPSLLINGVKRPTPLVRVLEVEFITRSLSKARSFGLSDEWTQVFVKKDSTRRQVLRVKSCLAGSKAESLLKEGDMVLAVNKEPVTCFRDIENACRALEKCADSDWRLNMTIFRQGREIDVLVGTDIRDGNGTTRMINWCGCIVQYPHPSVRALGFLPQEGCGIYVVRSFRGSPADRYGLNSLQWIVEINGKSTTNLDEFVTVTKDLGCDEFVRIKTINLKGKPQVLTLKQDLHYWPTSELRFDPEVAVWRRQTIKAV